MTVVVALMLGIALAGCATSPTSVHVSGTATTTLNPPIILPLPTTTGTRLPTTDPIATAVRDALGGDVLDSATTEDDGVLRVTAIVASVLPQTQEQITAARARGQILCLHVERAVWQRPPAGNDLREVRVTILGPMLDDYADRISGLYASAIVRRETAAAIPWATLSDAETWTRFDSVWLAPRFMPNQNYVVAGTATPTPR